jgi:uncharacterized membrane protein
VKETELSRRALGALAILVAIGLVLRFWTSSHLWLDEALTVDIARLPIRDIPAALRRDGHPPLYYVLLHGWMRVFGEGDTAVRALSGVLSVVALPLAWMAGRRAGGRQAAVAFVVLLALSPFAIRYATETRMYALVITLVLAGYLLVVGALERPSLVSSIGIALVTGALLLTHYWALWLVGATGLALVVRAWRGAPETRRASVRVLAALAGGGVLFLPWVGVLLAQSAHTGTPWAAAVRPTSLVTTTVQDFGGGDYAEGLLLGWALVGLFALGLLGRAVDRTRIELVLSTVPQVRREAIVVALTIALGASAGVATRTTFATRYAAVFLPLFLLVAAVGVTRFAAPVARGIVLAGVVVLGLIGGVHNVVTDRTQVGVVAAAIRAQAVPGDVVFICPDQLGPSVHRVLPDALGLHEVVYPTLAAPDFVDWRDYAARNAAADPTVVADQLAQSVSGAHAVWVVLSGGYKTYEGQCEAVLAELGVRLGSGRQLVAEDGDTFFEHAALFRFPGPASP